MKRNRVNTTQVIIGMVLVVLIAGRIHGQTKKMSPGDIIIGAKAGYSMIEGPYKNQLRGSYTVGGSLAYGNQGIVQYLMGEMDVSYSRYRMKESGSSYLETVTLAAGPLFYYPFASHLQVYTGVSAMGSYTHLYASRSNQNVKSLKPGLLAKAGVFIPIKQGFRIRAGAEYFLQYLSGKPLHCINFIGGLSYNFNPEEAGSGAAPIGDTTVRIDWYLTLAGNALRKGNIDEAKENYTKALAMDRTSREARDQLAGIKKAESDYVQGMNKIKDKRYYDALPLLDSAGKYLPAAREERDKIRKYLSMDITLLEKQGIDLYEKGDYRGCIAVMNRLLLIDPKNRVGLIYLPRAIKRQGALERLR
jgi:tetratricopeptide (TPR) repeat protein